MMLWAQLTLGKEPWEGVGEYLKLIGHHTELETLVRGEGAMYPPLEKRSGCPAAHPCPELEALTLGLGLVNYKHPSVEIQNSINVKGKDQS